MKRLVLLLLVSILSNSISLCQSFERIWELTDLGPEVGASGLKIIDVDSDGSNEIIIGGSTIIFLASVDQNYEVQYKSYGFASSIEDFALADTNQDGLFEVFVIDFLGVLHVLEANTFEKISTYNTGLVSSRAMAMDDTDNDGIYEVFIASDSGMKAFSYENGTFNFIKDLPVFDCIDMEIDDIDGDGLKEIVTGATQNPSKIFSSVAPDYELEWTSPERLNRFTLFDINNNGRKEIISIQDSEIKIIDGQTQTSLFSFNTGLKELYGVLAYDLEDNGSIEIIVGSGLNDRKVSAFTIDGTLLWETDEEFVRVYNLDIGDVDSDNEKELVWGAHFGLRIADLQSLEIEYESLDYIVIDYHLSDFDLDGEYELVIGTWENRIDNQTQLRFYNPVNHQITSTSSIPDSIRRFLNFYSGTTRSLSSKELIWESESRIVIFDPLVNEFVYISEDLPNLNIRAVAISDIDNDGIQEIFVGYDKGDLKVYQFDGTTYSEIFNENPTLGLGGIYTISPGNFDQDDDIELAIIVPWKVQVRDFPGFELLWESDSSFPQFDRLIAKDLDNDGINEIITKNSNIIYKFNGENGELINQYQHPFANGFTTTEISADNLDNSSEIELIVGYTTQPFILDSDIMNVLYDFHIPEKEISTFTVGDVDNDDQIDVFVLGERGVYNYELRFSTSTYNPYFEYPPLIIYPNPVEHSLTIETPEWETNKSLVLRIIDSLGRILLSKKVNSNIETVDFSSIPTGNYFILLLNDENLIKLNKIIKQ